MKPNYYQLKWSMIGMLFSFTTLILFSTCSKQNSIAEDVNSARAEEFGSGSSQTSFDNPFHRAVGGKISSQMGKKWIENYVRVNGNAFTYTLASSDVEQILKDPSVDGIVMYYAADDNGQRHILPFGVTNGKRMKSQFVATMNGPISWEEANHMISNHRGEVRSHFFGANTFLRLIKDKQLETIVITGGLDEKDDNQLLLSGPKVLNVETGLTADDEWGYEDKSNLCPDLCVDDD
jgi:hypothetical protein